MGKKRARRPDGTGKRSKKEHAMARFTFCTAGCGEKIRKNRVHKVPLCKCGSIWELDSEDSASHVQKGMGRAHMT